MPRSSTVPIPLTCPGCSARISAPDTAAGKAVKCPKCQTTIKVPAPAASAFEVVEDKPAPRKPPAPAKSAPAPAQAPFDLDDDEDERPRKKKPVAEDDDERPRKKRAAAEDDEDERPRKKRAAAEDDEDEDRPRKSGSKRGQKAGVPPALLFGGLAAGLFFFCAISFAVYWFAIREKSDSAGGGGGGSSGSSGSGSGGKAAVPTGWKEVKPPKAGFKAYMPAAPFLANKAPVIPRPADKMPTITDYSCIGPDTKTQCQILVFIFPDAVPAADREKAVTARMSAGAPKEFVKEVSRGKSTLGGKEATEVVEELNFAALMGGKPGPNGEKLPDKIVGVTRYCLVDNRAYLAMIAKADGRSTADEKGFFDNFELISETDSGSEPGSGTEPGPGKTDPKKPPSGGKGIARNWKDFTAPESFGFKARFPWYAPVGSSPWAPPEGSTGADEFRVQFSENGEILTYFAVVVVKFKPGLAAAGREKTLDDLVRLMRLPPELKPSAPKSVTWAGKPATEVVYEMSQPGANGRKGRVVIRRLVTDTGGYVGYVREWGGILPEDLAQFFDSFALTK
jgi:hypothetical protein